MSCVVTMHLLFPLFADTLSLTVPRLDLCALGMTTLGWTSSLRDANHWCHLVFCLCRYGSGRMFRLGHPSQACL